MGNDARTSLTLVMGAPMAGADRPTYAIREAAAADIPGVVAIERVSFSDPWSATMFRAHLTHAGNVNHFLVATEVPLADATYPDPTVVGYAVAHIAADESELLDIAVHPASRHRAIGGMLLRAIASRCHQHGAAFMYLDVRESNAAALALYERYGFAATGRRRRYYHHPTEDALLMRASLPLVKLPPTFQPPVTHAMI